MIKLKKVSYNYEADYNEDVVNYEYIITGDEFVNDEAKKIFIDTHLNSYSTVDYVGIKITETLNCRTWNELQEKIKSFIEEHTTSLRKTIQEINDFVNFLDSLTEEA